MTEYRVTIKGTFVVEADTMDEAEKIAWKMEAQEMYDSDVMDITPFDEE